MNYCLTINRSKRSKYADSNKKNKALYSFKTPGEVRCENFL